MPVAQTTHPERATRTGLVVERLVVVQLRQPGEPRRQPRGCERQPRPAGGTEFEPGDFAAGIRDANPVTVGAGLDEEIGAIFRDAPVGATVDDARPRRDQDATDRRVTPAVGKTHRTGDEQQLTVGAAGCVEIFDAHQHGQRRAQGRSQLWRQESARRSGAARQPQQYAPRMPVQRPRRGNALDFRQACLCLQHRVQASAAGLRASNSCAQ